MNMGLHVGILVMLMAAFTGTFCTADTDLLDVAAINSLYVALGSPPLQGWKATGGDPCAELWQGVSCVFSNITQLNLQGMNLGGELGANLNFPSIIQIDLSNNHIGGPIPAALPLTLRNLSLSSNQINGGIPDALSSLTQLSDLSLSNNLLDGEIPDVFLQLTGLINIDLSANNLSGQLPPSMGNLSFLSTLHLQNNELSGFLNVLQDLPLQDLNIENNFFFGPIPPQLFGIPNLRKDGNPFNTTVIPSPPAAAPAPAPRAMALSPTEAPWNVENGSFTLVAPIPAESARKSFISNNVIWITIAGFLVFIMLGVCLFLLWCYKRRPENTNAKKMDVGMDTMSLHKHQYNDPLVKASGKSIKSLGYGEQNRRTNMIPNVLDEQEIHVNGVSGGSKFATLQPPPSLPINIGGKDLTKSAIPTKVTERQVMASSLQVYTIALLRQYTNCFSQENYICEDMLGVVYRAELPDGKQLAVRKLGATASIGYEQFLQLVSNISKIQHLNIVKLMGYCEEDGQQLLVYDYVSKGTLHDALHEDNELHAKLSWIARVQVAIGAARALEYLHDNFEPPIVHQNFKSANVLLNTELEVRVSDCGFGLLLSSGSAAQFSGRHLTANGYGAPEFESQSYTKQSDVFSFGVVMLELLTGRKSYDRSRSRGEQFLIRWAVPQLHDIDALTKMVDPSLTGSYSMKSLSRFADIISSCIQREPEFRPAMAEVVQDLLQMI